MRKEVKLEPFPEKKYETIIFTEAELQKRINNSSFLLAVDKRFF